MQQPMTLPNNGDVHLLKGSTSSYTNGDFSELHEQTHPTFLMKEVSNKLFEDLEHILNFLKNLVNDVENFQPDMQTVHSAHLNSQLGETSSTESSKVSASRLSNLDNEIIQLIEKTRTYHSIENVHINSTSLFSLTYQEENMMLKHFFKTLLPLLDAHPNSPWPDLALKYCDFDIARSCFISLACIHINESRGGGSEYYLKGMAHVNSTMDYLIEYITKNSSELAESDSVSKGGTSTSLDVVDEEEIRNKQSNSFVILVLINVHILFAVLDNGKSSLSRFFFKIFGLVCNDTKFYKSLMENEKKRSLVVVLSWYDTVSAITSPDCRLPYCAPDCYGTNKDIVSTSKMMGCPGEIFKAMLKVCFMRHDLKMQPQEQDESLLEDLLLIKSELMNYRDYVSFDGDSDDYALRLKGAQCWLLAVYITLMRTVKPSGYEGVIQAAVLEFISVYGSMKSTSPIVTQMVWPVYAIGCECKSSVERGHLTVFMDTLYKNAQMGTLFSLKNVVEKVWKTRKSQEEVLTNWLDPGVDYLPL